jgi:hypothetical protein
MYVDLNYDLTVGKIYLFSVTILRDGKYIFKIFSGLMFIIMFSALFDTKSKTG